VARTAVQIADEYNRELSTPQGGLIAYYKFNEIAPSQTATDETGSFNGALLPSGYANGPQWSDGPDISLPVELSSFSAALTAENYVTLKWVTQSETGLVGYRMYRNGTLDQATAISITSNIIDATNTSTTQIYNLTDTEVTIGDTYYYWLESIDMDHTTFYGPVSVYLSGTVVPVLPELTTMNNAYPNPFKANNNTNIEVTVKAGEKGNVTIYNILGQAVKTFPVNEGINSLNWNGNDSKGNACGNGIYFYKLATPSMNITKKMVIIK
ncbi:MAG: T9SS type A sorting domain-containing protein, partial [Candidatus Cloacimonetes bacterium]|nr:T9SS type A sorting domain-containing protein [Candidatus Cloacimonadota bacterium]